MAHNDCGKTPPRRGFTLVELLVVIVIIAIGLWVLLPAIQAAREAQRRASCLKNCHQWGLALQNYASTYANSLPPSAGVFTTPTGQKTVGGYSFIVNVLPFMEHSPLYSNPPFPPIPNGDIDAAASGDAKLTSWMNRQLKELVCPSNRNPVFQNPTADPPQFALTNYKALGASTRDSLVMAADPNAKPPYGTAKIHPNGGLYPSDKPAASESE